MKPSSTSPSSFRTGAIALAAQVLLALATGLAPLSAPAQDNTSAPRPGEPITLNFSNADIESVARTMAVVTGRDVVVDPRVKGNINLITDRPVPPASAFNQFAAALRLQGFAVVESEGLYKIVPEADAKLQSNTVTTSTGATARAGGSQIVTQVFKLNYETANNLLPVLRPLIPPNNTINVNPGNNSLVITDYAENMRRLGRIIAALDVPNASDVEVIQLRHSIASDLVPLVQRLVDGSGSAGTPGAPAGGAPGQADASFRTTLLPDVRSNSIILRAANPARAQLVRTLIDKLDKPAIDTGNGEAGNIYVVYLKNSDAVKLAATLRAAISADGRGGSNSGLTGALQSSYNPQQQASSSSMAQTSTSSSTGLQGNSGISSQATSPLNNSNQPSTGGQVQADPSTNSLIITASEPQYRQLRAVIDRLDSKRAQVLVEALIVEVSAEKAAQFGVQWQGLLGGKDGQFIGTNSNVLGTASNILGLRLGSNPAGSLPQGLNAASTVTIAGQTVLGFLANFLQTNDDANILSTPNLLTLDNEEAKIIIGQNVPFPTGQYTNTGSATNTVNPFTTVERKDVGLTLRVRPTINEDNTVKLQIFQEVSTIQPGTLTNQYGPTTNKRSIESNVVVDDGNVIVLGGLLQDEYSNNTDKIPLAGDIPVVGALFRNETRGRKKTNLMVFLRPVVVRDTTSGNALTYDRYEAIRSIQTRNQPTENIFLNNVKDAPILPAIPPASPAIASPAPSAAEKSKSGGGIQGTRLIPPPIAPLDTPAAPGPLKGSLPPTADPSSGRELP